MEINKTNNDKNIYLLALTATNSVQIVYNLQFVFNNSDGLCWAYTICLCACVCECECESVIPSGSTVSPSMQRFLLPSSRGFSLSITAVLLPCFLRFFFLPYFRYFSIEGCCLSPFCVSTFPYSKTSTVIENNTNTNTTQAAIIRIMCILIIFNHLRAKARSPVHMR